MTTNEYQQLALRTANPLPPDELLLNGVLGLSGESGECSDLVKKHRYQGHDLDAEKLVKELGDCAWYLAIASHALGYELETVLNKNIAKLQARYPNGFDPERSRNRVSGDD